MKSETEDMEQYVEIPIRFGYQTSAIRCLPPSSIENMTDLKQRLFNLPYELFDQIRAEVFDVQDTNSSIKITPELRPPLQLAVNKATRDAFSDWYYGNHIFWVYCNHLSTLFKWLQSLPTEHRLLIKRINVKICPNGKDILPPNLRLRSMFLKLESLIPDLPLDRYYFTTTKGPIANLAPLQIFDFRDLVLQQVRRRIEQYYGRVTSRGPHDRYRVLLAYTLHSQRLLRALGNDNRAMSRILPDPLTCYRVGDVRFELRCAFRRASKEDQQLVNLMIE